MSEQEFRKTVADNIAYYRRREGMTQGELAAKLHYSDKSVSKWERAESVPDAYVLMQIADCFGVTIADLTRSGDPAVTDAAKVHKTFIPILAIGLVWVAASLIFFVLKLTIPDFTRSYIVFIYALPVSCIIGTVFACLWYGMLSRAVWTSGVLWSIFLSILLTFPTAKVLYLLILCVILQVLFILWFLMRHRVQKSRAAQTDRNRQITDHF